VTCYSSTIAKSQSIYSASKHALEGYSESLDHELRTRGIRVVVIEPGVTKTPFDANLLEPDSKIADAIRPGTQRRDT
jgi:short-subunit dehydrogenase